MISMKNQREMAVIQNPFFILFYYYYLTFPLPSFEKFAHSNSEIDMNLRVECDISHYTRISYHFGPNKWRKYLVLSPSA